MKTRLIAPTQTNTVSFPESRLQPHGPCLPPHYDNEPDGFPHRTPTIPTDISRPPHPLTLPPPLPATWSPHPSPHPIPTISTIRPPHPGPPRADCPALHGNHTLRCSARPEPTAPTFTRTSCLSSLVATVQCDALAGRHSQASLFPRSHPGPQKGVCVGGRGHQA